MNFEDFTAFEDSSLFTIEKAEVRGDQWEDDIMMSLSFKMSDEKNQIYREHESLLDALGQVGGLEAILFSIFSFLVDPISKGKYDSYLIHKLYKKAQNFAQD